MNIRKIVGTSLVVLTASVLGAQTPEPILQFEAASLKPAQHPNTGNQIMRSLQGGPGSSDPGMFHFTNVTLKLLVQQAYDLKEYQVQGPDWIDTAEYDLDAKMAPGTTREQAGRMMQTLLAERFHLVFHRETKPMQVYVLTVAKGGSKMKEAEPLAPPPANTPPAAGRGGVPPGGIRMMMTPDGVHVVGAMSMRRLTDLLTRQLEHPVLDQTELKKTYDVDITYMPDAMSGRGGALPGPGGETPQRSSEPTMTLQQALQEKLGLKLETRKDNAEILIVDRADKTPVEN